MRGHGAATEKARLPTVESPTEDTTRPLVPAECSVRRPCRSATMKPADPGMAGRSHVILYTSTRQLYIQRVPYHVTRWAVNTIHSECSTFLTFINSLHGILVGTINTDWFYPPNWCAQHPCQGQTSPLCMLSRPARE